MRGISLFSLRKRANECLISEKRVFAHFDHYNYENTLDATKNVRNSIRIKKVGKKYYPNVLWCIYHHVYYNICIFNGTPNGVDRDKHNCPIIQVAILKV